MKKMVRVFAAFALVSLVATTSFAPCYYNFTRHEEYWQYHRSCDPNCQGGQPYSDWWSLDGECDIDCYGNPTCWGDTQIRWRTDVQSEITGVCEICD